MIASVLEDLRSIFRLEAEKAAAETDDELQDLAIQQKQLRDRSVLASVIFAVGDIHRKYPLLLPIAAASVALKFFF